MTFHKTILAAASTVVLAGSVFGFEAREGREGHQGRHGRRRGDRPEFQNPDTNGDLLVDESEADAAIDRMAARVRERAAQHNAMVMDRADRDGDGQLSDEEIAAGRERREQIRDRIQERMAERGREQGGNGGRRRGHGPCGDEERPRPDTNGNLIIDEEEILAVIDRHTECMRARFAERNANILERFDTDKNGTLSDEEIAAAREAIERHRVRRQGGGGDREGRGNRPQRAGRGQARGTRGGKTAAGTTTEKALTL